MFVQAKNLLASLVIAALTLSGSSVAMAGPVGGPQVADESVAALGSDTYTVKVRGNEVTWVTVVGDGDTDLDLIVYDEFGNEIVSDLGATDRCVVRFNPGHAGVYQIKVKNLGTVFNRYHIRVD